jgi:hypothetical protein
MVESKTVVGEEEVALFPVVSKEALPRADPPERRPID